MRIGNGAADQLQLDIYGEAMDSIHLADTVGLTLPHERWTQIRRMLDWVCDNWDRPEEGIWETRGGRQPFTYGRFMCWVALDRAVRLARTHGRPAPLGRWIEERDRLYEQIMAEGWHPGRAAFVQHYHPVLLLLRRRPGPLRPPERRPAHLREDDDLRQPPRAINAAMNLDYQLDHGSGNVEVLRAGLRDTGG